MTAPEVTLSGMDEASARIITQLLLEDTMVIANSLEDTQNEGNISDQNVALEIFRQDINIKNQYEADLRMAKSIAAAVEADETALRETVSTGRHPVANSNVAGAALNDDDATKLLGDLEDEDLAKLAARFVPQLDGLTLAENANESNNEVASGWKRLQGETRACIACQDQKQQWQVGRMPCGHEYCEECLQQLFRDFTSDETLFPPRCCQQVIPLEKVVLFLKSDLIELFSDKKIEYGTQNRTYCSTATCSSFIRTENISNQTATCVMCGAQTCVECKNPTHVNEDCPADTGLQLLLESMVENCWQRCNSCRRSIELGTGCYHITCRCGAEFCYLCVMPWKTCACAQWDEARLIDRAEEIVQRDVQPEAPAAQNERRAQVARIADGLREGHNCNHGHMMFQHGSHQCEGCQQVMPVFVYRCGQCHIQYCRRCRLNRAL